MHCMLTNTYTYPAIITQSSRPDLVQALFKQGLMPADSYIVTQPLQISVNMQANKTSEARGSERQGKTNRHTQEEQEDENQKDARCRRKSM